MSSSCVQSERLRRSGMTLVELMVVIAIIVTLLTIAVLLWPSLSDRQQVASGSDLTQQWLLTARQWALRDQQPRGVRLLLDPNDSTNYTVRQMVYIGAATDFSGGTVTAGPAPTGTSTTQNLFFTGVDVTGGWFNAANPTSNPQYWSVQTTDKLELVVGSWGGATFPIVSITPTSATAATIAITVGSAITPGLSTSDYQIHRSPRPLPGEKTLDLPTSAIIDLDLGYPTPPVATTGNPAAPWISRTGTYDILFSPMGNLVLDLPSGTATPGKIILWVRYSPAPPDQPVPRSPVQGEQRLLAVYTGTGTIAAHPANAASGYADPFSFVRDGKASGL